MAVLRRFLGTPAAVLLLLAGAVRAQEGKDLLGDPLPEDAMVRMGSVRPPDKLPADFPRPFSLRGAALSADGKILATFGEPADPAAGRPIFLWDAATGKRLRTFEGHEAPIRALAISPDGKTLISTSLASDGAGVTRIWDVASGETRHVIPEGGRVLQFSPDGSTFWLVVRDRILLYRAETGQEVRRFLGPNLTLDISLDGRRALGISHERDSVLRVYDVSNNRVLHKLAGTEGAPKLARFSPDGRTVAVLDGSSQVLVWELATGRLVYELKGHQGRPFALAFSPDGRFLVTGGLDKTIRVWELASGQEAHRHTGHQGIVTVLGFARRSNRLVSGSTDHTALVWETSNSLVSELEIPRLGEDALRNLWDDLANPTPAKAYRAMGIFAETEQDTYAFLHRELEALLIPSKNHRLEELIKELDHEDSEVRQRATRELRKFRKSAQPLLLKVLKETQSAEVRARLRYILNGSGSEARFTQFDQLRMLRVIQLAEQLDTPQSRTTLEVLIAECPVEPIVQEAQRVLSNLQTGR